MSAIQRSLRGFLSLVASGGLLGLAMAGQAQQLTVTPAAPEAYQPFTLEQWFTCPFSDDPDDIQIAVSTDARTILLDTNVGPPGDCFGVPPVLKRVANIVGLPGGTYRTLLPAHDDLGGPAVEVGDVTISPAPPIQPVFAFYNESIGHYFITAGSAERDSLLGGGGGGGWGIVDEGFNAWPAAGPAPDAAKPVCRFYSAAVNSHFYTAGPNECELLKQPGSGWTYEGITFRALVPTQGSCYPGTTPVWRLYNDRFAQADSNHRFVTSTDTYRHMIANGWIGEGVTFCSPES